MTSEQKQIWLDALRSGEYAQCDGVLTKDGGHCCLGVAHVVLSLQTSSPFYIFDENGDYAFLPGGIQRTLGQMNDAGDTFPMIADWVEANVPVDGEGA